jgi:hypothetical protein
MSVVIECKAKIVAKALSAAGTELCCAPGNCTTTINGCGYWIGMYDDYSMISYNHNTGAYDWRSVDIIDHPFCSAYSQAREALTDYASELRG